ncbi:MAG: hypothetical protein NZM00_00355, partial [Anaerolinea sp.]|nr:hypothetical protein [Anaerolinea sp.]
MTDPPQPAPSARKRRYPHVYYRRERRPAPPVFDWIDDGDDYYGYDPRDLPDPRDVDRGDEPPDDALPASGSNAIWKWLLVIIMILIVVSMIAADLNGII